jgi:hypothetical protein
MNIQENGGCHRVKEYIEGKKKTRKTQWGIDGYF